MPRCRKRHIQVELEFNRRGGHRKGAGRKPTPGQRRRVPHTARPPVNPRHPHHITLRVLDQVGRLRRRDAFRVVRAVMLHVATREDFRIVHLSIQGNHIHLFCEADTRKALSSGIQAFKISAAKRMNRLLGRRGEVFADRYHEEVVTSVGQVRNTINYILNNWRKHREDRGVAYRVDPYSTGIFYRGWAETDIPKEIVIPPDIEVLPYREPRTWLLAEGWKRAKPISLYEVPGERPDRRGSRSRVARV